MGRVVRVLEGHAVPSHGEGPIGKSAEPILRLAVADAVGGVGDDARSRLQDVGKVSRRRGVLANVLAGDLAARRLHVEQTFDWRELRRYGSIGIRLNSHFLGYGSQFQRERNLGGVSRS